MFNRTVKLGLVVLAAAGVGAAHASGVTVYNQDDQFIKLGGRVQVQYHQKSPEGKSSEDKIFLRRLRAYIEGSLYKDWKAKIQWEMGKAKDDNELAVKSAYMQYKGFSGGKLYIGNFKAGFSRENLNSSKKQQLVERTFVGDHNYGVAEYLLGVRFDGYAADKKITYILSAGGMNIDPDDSKLDFDTPINNGSDWNQGWVIAGRVDYHPFGYLPFSQGDFDREQKLTIGLGAFGWSNDGDNNTNTDAVGNHKATYIDTEGNTKTNRKVDVDSANGIELSAAYRNAGFSVDAQYNVINASTVDNNYTGGIFKAGETTLTQMALEGGYMVIPARLELVAGVQTMDADGYKKVWTRNSLGINWFFHKHDIKVQLTYRQGSNLYDKDGKDGKDQDELFLQTLYVF